MTPLSLLADALRSALILGLALAAMPLLRRSAASTRRLVLALALGAAALVPLVSRAAPGWHVLPAPALPVAGTPFAEPPEEAVAAAPAVVRTGGDPVVAEARVAHEERSIPWGSVLVAAWALGALVVLGRLGVGLAGARGIVRRAEPVSRAAIDAAMREAGAPSRVQVRATDEVDAPAVTGVLRPVVLVPRAALGWSDERWRAVLLHELAHVRQHDCLAHLAGQIACAWSWFDPLVWLAVHRLRTERELAADERALATGTRPTDYASHLFAIAAGAAGTREVPVGALGMAGRSELPARIEAIVRPGGPRPPLSARGAIAIGAAAAAVLGAVACVASGAGGGGSGAAAPAAGSAAQAAGGAPTTGVRAGDGAAEGEGLKAEVAAAIGAPAGSFELTIRPEIQGIVDEEMKRLEGEWHPEAATAIVLDPATGEVLALHGPATATAPRGSGSTMKPLVIAGALEDRAVAPGDRFFCDNGGRKYPGDLVLRDAVPHGELDVAQILEVSSNIGASRIVDRLGGAGLGRWLGRFHLGAPSGIELRAAAPDAVPAYEDGSFRAGAMAAGHDAAVSSPMHMAAAYAVFANQGVYNSPTLVRRTGGAARDGAVTNERVLRPETASAVVAMLERVVYGEHGTAGAARIEGVRVAGKTGTADLPAEVGKERYYTSFIGLAPVEKPRFVVLVGAVVPSENATGGRVAVPVFARIVARALGR